jgi:hypothetical protein
MDAMATWPMLAFLLWNYDTLLQIQIYLKKNLSKVFWIIKSYVICFYNMQEISSQS